MPRGVQRSLGTGADEGAFLFRGTPGPVFHGEDVRSAAEVVQGLHQFAGWQAVVPPDWEAMEAMVCRIFMMPFP